MGEVVLEVFVDHEHDAVVGDDANEVDTEAGVETLVAVLLQKLTHHTEERRVGRTFPPHVLLSRSEDFVRVRH